MDIKAMQQEMKENVKLMDVVDIKTASTVHIECPSCDNWETAEASHPRHRLNHFALLEWLPDEDYSFGGYPYEVSIMQCSHCEHEFKLNWKYYAE